MGQTYFSANENLECQTLQSQQGGKQGQGQNWTNKMRFD